VSSPQFSNHHCKLSITGHKKYKDALSEQRLSNLSNLELARTLGCDRSHIPNLDQNTFIGKYTVLKRVFDNLELELEETDYEQVPYHPKTKKPAGLKLDETTQFKHALLSLNYKDQSRLFKDFWDLDTRPQMGAFLVRGKPYSGQRWLLHRLLHEFRLDTTAHKFPVVLPQEREVYIEDLWTRLSNRLQLNRNASVEEIVQRLYNYWQEGTVILSLENLEQLYETEHQIILQQLWQPLVNLLNQHPQACNSYFLMFLVDNCGNFREDRLEWATLKTWQPDQILDLKPIERFPEIIITNWIKEHRELLSNLLPESSDYSRLGNKLWQQSLEGVPELVMQEICKHYRRDWHKFSNNS
jgi:inactive STAND